MTTDKNTLSSDPQAETDKAFSQSLSKAQATASDLADEARSQAIEITDEVKTQAKSALGNRKDMAARELNGVAAAMRQAGQALDEEDKGTFAEYSYRVADQVERASTYLERTDVGELVSDTEDFARRQPELYIGGAFTLGLLAARFLKSSSPSRSTGRNRGHNGYRTHSDILSQEGYGGTGYSWQDRNDDLYGSRSTTTPRATSVRES